VSDVLVDSSVWIDYFRGEPKSLRRLDPLIAEGRAALAGPIYAEVVSGARQRSVFDRLALLLGSLDWLESPPSPWEQIAEARFNLARQGAQVHLVDLWIALTALHGRHALLTRDRDFSLIARVLPLDLDLY